MLWHVLSSATVTAASHPYVGYTTCGNFRKNRRCCRRASLSGAPQQARESIANGAPEESNHRIHLKSLQPVAIRRSKLRDADGRCEQYPTWALNRCSSIDMPPGRLPMTDISPAHHGHTHTRTKITHRSLRSILNDHGTFEWQHQRNSRPAGLYMCQWNRQSGAVHVHRRSRAVHVPAHQPFQAPSLRGPPQQPSLHTPPESKGSPTLSSTVITAV